MRGPFLGLNILISWPKIHHVVEHEVLVMQFADFLLGLLAFSELMKSLKHCGMANEQAYPLCYFESSFFLLFMDIITSLSTQFGSSYFSNLAVPLLMLLSTLISAAVQ